MRILAVDDDQGTRAIVSKLLTQRGYEVDSAPDGPEALDRVKERPYDLAVLDYEMPELNGIELFQRITLLRPETLGIFLTAHARLDVVFPAVETGVARILAKPVDAEELLSIVEELIGPPVAT